MTFSQRAVLAAVMVGATAPLVGTFLVRRGMALVGDGLGHLAFAGVAIAPLIGVSPLPVALVVALAGAAVVEIVRWKSAGRSDLAIAFVFYASIALAVVVLAAGKRYNSRVLGVLFGSLLTVSNWELVTMALVLFAATLVTVFFYRPLVMISIDDELAQASGVSPRRYGMLISLSTAAVVVAGMPAVGILLISALLVLPAATAQNAVSGFARTLGAASLLGASTAAVGTLGALRVDVPPGAAIVVLASALYLSSLGTRRTRN